MNDRLNPGAANPVAQGGITEIQMARNLNELIFRAGLALDTVSTLLKVSDQEKLDEEISWNGLAYLLDLVAGGIVEHSRSIDEHLTAVDGIPPR